MSPETYQGHQKGLKYKKQLLYHAASLCKTYMQKAGVIDFIFYSLEQFNAPRDVMPRGLKYNAKRSECKKKSTNTNKKSTA